MEEIRKLDLGELKDAKAELMGQIAEKEAEDNMDSISNKLGEPSTYTKMTNKSQILELRAQLDEEKMARAQI